MWAAAALAAALSSFGEMPAVAADHLLFSADGQAWATELAGPIFVNAPVLVPGNQVSASFWVQNASTDPADLLVALASDEVSQDGDGFWLRATTDIAGAVPTDDAAAGMLSLATMPAQEAQKITVTVGLHETAGNNTQDMTIPVAFEVRLTQSIPTQVSAPVVGEDQPQSSPNSPFGSLADTGFTMMWILGAGATLAAAGLLAVAWSRRIITNEEGSHAPA